MVGVSKDNHLKWESSSIPRATTNGCSIQQVAVGCRIPRPLCKEIEIDSRYFRPDLLWTRERFGVSSPGHSRWVYLVVPPQTEGMFTLTEIVCKGVCKRKMLSRKSFSIYRVQQFLFCYVFQKQSLRMTYSLYLS